MATKRPTSRKARPVKTATRISDWKKGSSVGTVALQVPSGNTCLVERRPLQALITSDLIPNLLVSVVQEHLEKNRKDGEEVPFDAAAYDWNPEQVSAAFQMVDNIVVAQVRKPRVRPVPRQEIQSDEKYDPDFERDENALYVDEVDSDDKEFIFQFVIGGTADLAKFREQSSGVLAGLSGS